MMNLKRWSAVSLMLFVAGCGPARTDFLFPADAATDGGAGSVPDVVAMDAGLQTDAGVRPDVPAPQDVPRPVDVPVVRPDVPAPVDIPPVRDVPTVTDTGPTLFVPGFLLRGTSDPTVFFFSPRTGRIHPFMHLNVYYSWYQALEGIRTVSDAELARYMRGRPITIRPGTWLVKRVRISTVYAVTSRCGELRAFTSETQINAQFGTSWNTGRSADRLGTNILRTLDIDAFFASYREGTPLVGTVHPDGTLIRYEGRSERYLVMGGRIRLITLGAFFANRFQEAAVVLTAREYPSGPPVTGYEPDLSEPDCGP